MFPRTHGESIPIPVYNAALPFGLREKIADDFIQFQTFIRNDQLYDFESTLQGFGDILHLLNGHASQIHLDQGFLDVALLCLLTLNDLRFKWQRSQTGNVKFHFARFRQKFAFIASGSRLLTGRTALIPRSLADRVGFRIQKRIQRILDRLSNQSVKMRPNLFFVNFNRSGDCLFVFLRYIFHSLFSFPLIMGWSL